MQDLEERIGQLERDEKRGRIAVSLLALVLGVGLLFAMRGIIQLEEDQRQATKFLAVKKIEARRIHLLDKEDKVRFELQADSNPPSLVIYDSSGNYRIALICADENDGATVGMAKVVLYDKDKAVTGMMARDDGGAGLVLSKREGGKHRAALIVSGDGASLSLADGNEVRRIHISAPDSGDPLIKLEKSPNEVHWTAPN